MSAKNYKDAQKIVGYSPSWNKPVGEFYATPEIAIVSLLDRVKFGSSILEPCCGDGAISKVLEQYKYNVVSRDLYDWGYGETGKDFLKESIIDVNAVITNPPFSLTLEFAERALLCTKAKVGKVAILNRIQWIEGKKRKQFFENSPLEKVLVFSKRIPRFRTWNYTGKIGTSLICFAWFVWDWNYAGKPIIEWI